MSGKKHFDLICLAAMVLAVVLTMGLIFGKISGFIVSTESTDSYFTESDLRAVADTSSATKITLNGESGNVSGDGAAISGGTVTISDAGVYVISGKLTDGAVVVNAGGIDEVTIVLDGAELYCADDAAFRVDNAEKVYLLTAKNSINTIKSGSGTSPACAAAGRDGAVYSRDDLTLNGEGSLTVETEYTHGIVCNDNLVIAGGSINVAAVEDGINVNDSVCLKNAELTIKAGDEGIAVTNDSDGKGTYYGESGTVTIDATGKGVKSDGAMTIAGGTYTINAKDDALHAAKDVLIEGGALTIDSADDGLHSDAGLTVNGGKMTINSCYEGLEAITIEINGGEFDIHPTDDGMNANGNGLESSLTVNGGKIIVVNADGRDADGLDSNGNLTINGGDVYLSLGADGGNSALDYGSESGGVCAINGGTVIACGSAMMLENISASSMQGSIMKVYSETQAAGTTITLKDASGNVILTKTIDAPFASATLSAAAVKAGETYTVEAGSHRDSVTLQSTVYTEAQTMGGMGAPMTQNGQGGQNQQQNNNQQNNNGQQNGGNMPSSAPSGDGNQQGNGNANPQMPQGGGQPQDGQMPQGGAAPGDAGEDWDMDNASAVTSPSYTPTAQDWLIVGVSAAGIVIGLIVVMIFKRRKE